MLICASTRYNQTKYDWKPSCLPHAPGIQWKLPKNRLCITPVRLGWGQLTVACLRELGTKNRLGSKLCCASCFYAIYTHPRLCDAKVPILRASQRSLGQVKPLLNQVRWILVKAKALFGCFMPTVSRHIPQWWREYSSLYLLPFISSRNGSITHTWEVGKYNQATVTPLLAGFLSYFHFHFAYLC